MTKGRFGAITMAMALGASPLVAQQQQPQGGMMMGQGMHQMCSMMGQGSMMGPGSDMAMSRGMMGSDGMMGMMGAMTPGASSLLGAADRLGLADDQRTRLEELKASAGEERRTHMRAAMAAHQRASKALEGDMPDMGAYESALAEAADHMVMARVAMARSSLEVRSVLTPEQREQIGDGMALMGAMMCGMRSGEGGTQESSAHDTHH